MAATHLRFSQLPSTVTSGLPTKVVIKAYQSNGEVDTDWNGKIDVRLPACMHGPHPRKQPHHIVSPAHFLSNKHQKEYDPSSRSLLPLPPPASSYLCLFPTLHVPPLGGADVPPYCLAIQLVPSRSLADDSFDDRQLGSWRMASNDDSHDKDESLACSIVRSPPNPKSASPFCMRLVGGVGDAKVDRNWEKGCQRVFDHIRPTRMSTNVRTSSNERESLAIFVTG